MPERLQCDRASPFVAPCTACPRRLRLFSLARLALAIALACPALLLRGAPPPPADETASLEYQVKAAYLFNFTRFIEWPSTAFPDASAPFSICVLGDDRFGATLDRMVEGETVNGRRLIVRRISHPQPGACHMLFAGRSEKDLAGALQSLGTGVLTVGEGDRFLRDGGMIAFVIENGRVRFDIRPGPAVNSGLKLSSKLLNVARSVEK